MNRKRVLSACVSVLFAASLLIVTSDAWRRRGGRGIKGGLNASPVRSIREVHPVFSLREV